MKERRTTALGIALVVLGSIVATAAVVPLLNAQVEPAGDARTIYLDPTEVEAFTIRWEGRTLSSTPGDHTVTITPSGPLKNADAAPNAIKTALSAAGSDLSFTLSPNAGCGTAGCRRGNTYQIRVQVTDTAGLKPVFNLLLKVQQKQLQG